MKKIIKKLKYFIVNIAKIKKKQLKNILIKYKKDNE